MQIRLAALTLATCFLLGCATSRPYAEVTGDSISQADGFSAKVIVAGVDGQLTFSNSMTEIVAPGFRTLLLATTRRGRTDKGTAIVFPLTAKPCLRYHFTARHESLSELHPWQPVLIEVEPIPECVAKFPQHAPSLLPAPAPWPGRTGVWALGSPS